jgi:hypothetical protein
VLSGPRSTIEAIEERRAPRSHIDLITNGQRPVHCATAGVQETKQIDFATSHGQSSGSEITSDGQLAEIGIFGKDARFESNESQHNHRMSPKERISRSAAGQQSIKEIN